MVVNNNFVRACSIASLLAVTLMATHVYGQHHNDALDHHSPTDPVHYPVDHVVPHHEGSGDPMLDHHFPHLDPVDPHHHMDGIHDSDPHHDHHFQHDHITGEVHHEDHHHSDGMHHHHPGHVGDANLDGHINLVDMSLLMHHIGQTSEWDHGDFDGNRLVDRSDVASLVSSYGSVYGSAHVTSTAAVPEPSTAVLIAAGFLTVAAFRWSRRRK